MGTPRRLPLIAVALVLVVASAGCTGPAHAPVVPIGAPPASAEPTASVSPPPTGPPYPVPTVLWGTWQPVGQVVGTGDLLLNLVFSAHSFAFYDYDDDPSAAAIGRAWAVGPDQLELGTRGPCETPSVYTWRISGDRLTLGGGSTDRCQRHEPLVTRVWRRVSSRTAPADTDLTT
jgi:hypothetical protein